MNFLENISVVWQKLSLVQRALLVSILVTGGITAVFLTKWASKPDMRPLYSGVSPEDSGRITEKLEEKGIVFELRGTGNIYVPKEYVYQLRGDLAKDGLPGSDSKGYKLFDEGGFGASPFLNNINKIRALQDEIARSIQLFDTVATARVLIVQPEQNVFKGSKENSKASVVLQMKPGFRVKQSTVAAITHMVASSIEGLAAENVTIVDNYGAMLSSVNGGGMSNSANTFMDYKERTEQRLADNAQRMLETVLGPGRSNVIVSAVIDMDSEETLVTTYEKGIPTKEEIDSTTTKVGGGTDKNGNVLPVTEDAGTEVITTEYQVPETVKKTVKMAGKIVSISVAVVVDLTLQPKPVVVADGETAPPPTAPTKIMEVAKVKSLIFSALGRGMLTEDNLTVEDIPFVRAAIPPAIKEPAYVPYVGLVKQGSLGIMAICALFALKMFSGKVKPGKGAAPVAQLSGGGENAIAALQPGDMREQISAAYRGDPEQVRELFTSWIEEKG